MQPYFAPPTNTCAVDNISPHIWFPKIWVIGGNFAEIAASVSAKPLR